MSSARSRTRPYAAALAVLALGAGAAFWFTPHYDAWSMKRAADANDLEAFAAHVDLEAVRESLKQARRDGAAPRFGGRVGRLAQQSRRLLFGALTDRLIDRLVTHERLAREIRGEPGRGDAAKPLEIALGYESPSRFAITVRDPAQPDARPVALVFARHGLADWKLSAIRP